MNGRFDAWSLATAMPHHNQQQGQKRRDSEIEIQPARITRGSAGQQVDRLFVDTRLRLAVMGRVAGVAVNMNGM